MPNATITEIRQTGSAITSVQSGETSSITDTYSVVVSTDNIAAEVLLGSWAGTPAKPTVRSRHPVKPAYVCVDISVQQLTARCWQMTAKYTSRALSPGFCRLSRRGSTRQVPLWVYGTLPTDGTTPWFPAAPASGVNVDVAGTPQAYPCWHHELSIELHIDQSLVERDWGAPDHYQSLWTPRVGERNSALFLGYSTGTVVFKGWSEQLTEDPHLTVTLHFEADEYYHLEQRCLPHVDGRMLLTASQTVAGQTIKQSGRAYWYQPYHTRTPTDLNTLYDFGELASTTPGYP